MPETIRAEFSAVLTSKGGIMHMKKTKLTFDAQGISIPYPQTDVHLYSKIPAAES